MSFLTEHSHCLYCLSSVCKPPLAILTLTQSLASPDDGHIRLHGGLLVGMSKALSAALTLVVLLALLTALTSGFPLPWFGSCNGLNCVPPKF